MNIFNTYSKRQKGLPDIYTYDAISDKLKNQIYHIWNDYFDQTYMSSYSDVAWERINNIICREEGMKTLTPGFNNRNTKEIYQVEKYFESIKDVEKIIDVIDIVFFMIEQTSKLIEEREPYLSIKYSAIDAINDLNTRFLENGVGYEFANGQIIRVDNKLLHKEVIQKTLNLISNEEYKNANEEYLKAHEHFRFNRNKECLNECLKAFETTMKIVIKRNNWDLKENDNAKGLINRLIENKFIKGYNESHLHALINLLEGQIPTIRNKNSGHGQGNVKVEVSKSLASYMLYVTGATINLIVELQQEKESIV